MKHYPSICHYSEAPKGANCLAFYKYDGSNLRFEWSHKQGWHKFGTRQELTDINNPLFGPGVEYFLNNIADNVLEKTKNYVGRQFKNTRFIIAYGEFMGLNSGFGKHELNEPKTITLFDIWLYQKGFIKPKDFRDIFSTEDYAAKCVYDGKFNNEFIQQVQQNTLPGCTLNEGVICKWENPDKANSKQSNVYMTKIKTLEYLEKLKAIYGNNWLEYV